MKYLKNIKNIEQLKKEYRRMAMELHPDRGGDAEEFKILVNEYEILTKKLAKENNKNEEEYNKDIELDKQYMDIINQLIKFDGLTIEVVGSWIWLSGNTYPAKDVIKGLGFKWASKKKMWYLSPEDHPKRRGGKELSMDEIKSKYGVKAKVKTEGAKQIA